MLNWLWTIPIISALCGLIFTLLVRKILLHRIPAFIPFEKFREKISDKNNVQNIVPLIEGHIDEFLKVRLAREMPMIGMFIGDKTIAQLKKLFMEELEELFPQVIDNYFIELKARSYFEETVINILKDKLRLLPLWGVLCGLVIGLIQIAVLNFLQSAFL